MPIYEYRCPNGHAFEVFQSMADDPVAVCEECDAPVERVFHPVAVHFKGSGFYTTDYAKKKSEATDGASKEKSNSGKGSESKAAKDTSGSSGDSGKSGGSSGDSGKSGGSSGG